MGNESYTTREELRKVIEQRDKEFDKEFPPGSPERQARINKVNRDIAWLMKHPINPGAG